MSEFNLPAVEINFQIVNFSLFLNRLSEFGETKKFNSN